jgi:hypothetical protein
MGSKAAPSQWCKTLANRVKTHLRGYASDSHHQRGTRRAIISLSGQLCEKTGSTVPFSATVLPFPAKCPGMCLSRRHRGHQLGELDDIEHPPEIVGERGVGRDRLGLLIGHRDRLAGIPSECDPELSTTLTIQMLPSGWITSCKIKR